jgi:lysophospholipase L1-like esterase
VKLDENLRYRKAFTISTIVLGLIAAGVIYRLSDRISTMTDIKPAVDLKVAQKNCQNLPPLLQGVRTIVCVGDSTTLGQRQNNYVEIFKSYLAAIFPENPINIVNAGVNGDSSSGVLARFEDDVLSANPQLIILMVGIGDAAASLKGFVDSGQKDTSGIEKCARNVEKMIKLSKARGVKILVVSPAVVLEGRFKPIDEHVESYVIALAQVAKTNDVPFVNVRERFNELIKPYRSRTGAQDFLLTHDGLHFNVAGMKVVANSILDAIGVTSESRAKVQLSVI